MGGLCECWLTDGYFIQFKLSMCMQVVYKSMVFRRNILCDAKPKPVSRKFRSKRCSLGVAGGGGKLQFFVSLRGGWGGE